MPEPETWKIIASFVPFAGAVVAAFIAWRGAKGAQRSSRDTIASNLLRAKQEILQNALTQMHAIDNLTPLFDYTGAIGDSAEADHLAGQQLIRRMTDNNSRLQGILIPVAYQMSATRQATLQGQLNGATQAIAAVARGLQADRILDNDRLRTLNSPIPASVSAISFEIQSELEHAVQSHQSLAGLNPRPTWGSRAVQLSKNVCRKIFCFVIG